jgi:hypothetical protein
VLAFCFADSTERQPAVTQVSPHEPHHDEGSAFAESQANGRFPCGRCLPDKHRPKRITKASEDRYDQAKHVPSLQRIIVTGIFPMLCIGRWEPVPAGSISRHTSGVPARSTTHKIAVLSLRSVHTLHCHLLSTRLRIWPKHDLPKSQSFCGCQRCHALVRREKPTFLVLEHAETRAQTIAQRHRPVILSSMRVND